jgi:hypothetical protein
MARTAVNGHVTVTHDGHVTVAGGGPRVQPAAAFKCTISASVTAFRAFWQARPPSATATTLEVGVLDWLLGALPASAGPYALPGAQLQLHPMLQTAPEQPWRPGQGRQQQPGGPTRSPAKQCTATRAAPPVHPRLRVLRLTHAHAGGIKWVQGAAWRRWSSVSHENARVGEGEGEARQPRHSHMQCSHTQRTDTN